MNDYPEMESRPPDLDLDPETGRQHAFDLDLEAG